MPPKDWFYGIDHINSERIVKYFQDNKIFDVYKFEDIEIFLKTKLELKDYFQLINYYFFFKIKKPQYVFALNASYIAYCNLVFKKKIVNFFSQILGIRCVMRWDHINEQIPNIVEHIISKSKFEEIYDYKNFFLDKINNKKFYHYTWQIDEYFCEDNYLTNTLNLNDFKLKKLNYYFTFGINKKSISFKENNNNMDIALVGYMNDPLKPKISFDKVSLVFKDKKKIFNKNYYKNFMNYSIYEYSKKKIESLKIKNMQFYGINPSKNYGRVINAKEFFSEISKFFMIINPINPISLTITTKFYLIYLYGGFCIHELPSTIPPKLEKFKEYIFYRDERELKSKIEYLKNNLPTYFSIKNEINQISKNLMNESFDNFIDEFKIK